MAKAIRKQQDRLRERRKKFDALKRDAQQGCKRPGSMNFKKG